MSAGGCDFNIRYVVKYYKYINTILLSELREDANEEEYEKYTRIAYIPIIATADGDYICIERAQEKDSIVYLDHDYGYSPVYAEKIANSFESFFTTWSELGCPDPEIEIIQLFIDKKKREISSKGKYAEKWIAWLGR